ncbi:MAG TPA: queuosine salvage family protein [Verrucomicrobiae bacterium]|nr:queuosine salvage family protein [Verrucomicrobiae bacterium]
MGALPDLVRKSCAAAAAQASSVRVAVEKIPGYALSLPPPEPFPPHDPRWHFSGTEADTVAYFITLDTVNFGSGWFPWLNKRAPLSGYFTIASFLADRFRSRGPLTAAELAEISCSEVTRLFGQQGAPEPVAELMELFTQGLSDLGRLLLERYDGGFMNLVEQAGGSAVRLAELLIEMPLFRDRQPYRGGEVHFYKRAQIAPQDLALAFAGKGAGSFGDLERLTIFADNLVPHVLRVDGVLEYAPLLARAIDDGEPLAAGSAEEVELRACAVHAVELVARALREAGRPAAPREIDFLLWNRGQHPFYKSRPRHRTRTPFY